jgi:hypothetical protein
MAAALGMVPVEDHFSRRAVIFVIYSQSGRFLYLASDQSGHYEVVFSSQFSGRFKLLAFENLDKYRDDLKDNSYHYHMVF